MPKTFKNFIFSIHVLLLTTIFVLCFLFTTYLHTTLTQEQAIKNSDSISNQIYSSMYQVMKKGWSRNDLETFTQSIKDNFQNSKYEINIYRAPKVESMFGSVQESEKDYFAQRALEDGKKLQTFENNIVRKILPLNAKQECLTCHSNVKVGDTLGVIDVQEDLNDIFESTAQNFIWFFLIIIPLFAIAAYISSKFTTDKLSKSITLFHNRIENINSLEDFKDFKSSDIDLHFLEMNSVVKDIDILANKLKTVAVDKDLLEFEVKLLDKFIITTDVVQDWREFINDLLFEINKVMETYTLMTVFRVGDDQFEIDIFWLGIPSEKIKKVFEDYVNNSILESQLFIGMSDFIIKHVIADRSRHLDDALVADLNYRTKSLFLDAPKIGGVVGIGVQADLAIDPVRHIVLDSILTTMANLVGSVKAINKYTQDLEFYAARDPLTNLFNQRIFNDMLDYEIKRARRHEYSFALMVLDCDNFKHINDTYGHVFGDKYLQSIADILEAQKRDGDIVARYGGDEFTIILPECDLNGAVTTANRIVNVIRDFELTTDAGTKVNTTMSIGISIYPTHAMTKKELFFIADGMMYKAKEEGKNSVKIPTDEDVINIVKEEKNKSSMLVNAIAKEQIIPYFQPIAPSNDVGLVIHELLMRINVDGKIVSAYEFIETAEGMNLINKMDLMVIKKAFEKIKESNYKGILFINLSPKSLVVGDFINSVNALVDKYQIDKSNIVFEITERETVKNFTLLEKFVLNLKSDGYKFAIDDFGSGFSSFHYIKKFPIDYLKIDGEFIININKDKKDRAFVRSIVTLAQELGVKTVAEFVEDQDIVDELETLDIDFYQGYFIGKPSEDFVV